MGSKKNLFVLFFWLSVAPAMVHAQAEKPAVKRNADDPLVFKAIKNQGAYMMVEYTIPFEGVVSFELLDEEEKRIWSNQYINKPGDNSIKFSTKPLVEGKYFYTFYYKGNETRKYFDYRATN